MSVEISVSNKLLGEIDNLVLQKVISLTSKLPVGKTKKLHLEAINDSKQKIEVGKGIISKTLFCAKPINADIIACQTDENNRLYCFADEIKV